MVWRSTKESVEIGEVSVLALIETICAVSLSFWIAISVVQSWRYTIIAAFIAPFLLLRTELSTERGLKWYNTVYDLYTRIDKFIDSSYKYESKIISILHSIMQFVSLCLIEIPVFFAIFISPFFIRTISVILTALQHPLVSIGAIPHNWYRLVLCTDFFRIPEILPGVEDEIFNRNVFRIRFDMISIGSIWQPFLIAKKHNIHFSNQRLVQKLVTVVYVCLCIFFSTILFLLALPYRYSIKSTAVVWLPLIWIILRIKRREEIELADRLSLLNKSSSGRFIFLFSVFTIVVFTVKLLLFNAIYAFSAWWNTLTVAPLLIEIVAPLSLPPWQLASVLNSIISIFLYMRASHGLIFLQNPERNTHRLRTINLMIKIGDVIKLIISLYTISCLLYILCSQLPEWQLPPIENRIFPWMLAD